MSPGAENRNAISLDGSEGIAGVCSQLTLADNNEPGLGPLVEPFGVGSPSAVVGGQENIGGRIGRRTFDQLVKTKLLKITGQEEMAPADSDVEHEAARVVRGLRVPTVATGAKP